MAFFTILFGTRNIDANERHHGVVAAIAVEAVVKLVALMAVGLLVVFGIGNGLSELFGHAPPTNLHYADVFGSSWITQTFLAAAAVICLPRQFQMTIVECPNEQHLRTASWMFPLYMLLICLFVLPIAIAGLNYLPEGSNPDMFVLTLPMWAGQDAVALLAFLGGFSSATSMVIVSSIALSTMISNHIIMPIALRLPWVALDASGDIRRFLLNSRRVSHRPDPVARLPRFPALGAIRRTGFDRPDFLRRRRPVPAGADRRPVLAPGHRARRDGRRAGRLPGLGLHAVPAELSRAASS